MLTGLLILIPLAGSVFVLFSGNGKVIRQNALIVSLIEFGTAIFALTRFTNTGVPESSFSLKWIELLGVHFHFAMDGISLLLILLTSSLFTVIFLISGIEIPRRINVFYGLLLITEASLVGVFTAQDVIVFYLFWELALIPVYFIVAVWGGQDRIRITFKFLIYTLTGSLLMLAALIYLYFHTPEPHSSELSAICKAVTTKESQFWIFSVLFLAFAIKIPIIPFHSWQPDTYVTAPTQGSIILAGIMSKMGIYGMIRLLVPVCPLVMPVLKLPVIMLISAGIIYSSIIAIRQDDLKRFIAYVSIAHLGLISAGILSGNATALKGAVLQMISHGINVVGLFIIVDIITRRFKSRNIKDLGGIMHSLPLLGILFMIILLGTAALPLTNGFVGEFMILLGLYSLNPWISLAAGTTIIFSAVYMLWMYQRVMLGDFTSDASPGKMKLDANEIIALLPLVILVLVIGCYPKPFLDLTEPVINILVNMISITP